VRRTQNVSAPVAVVVIAAALGLLFLVFNRPAPEVAQPSRPVPEAPPVEDQEVSDMYKGLSPLGIVAVVPPLMEDRRTGVRVATIVRDSPADRAGLKPGDFITDFDHKRLRSSDALIYLLARVQSKSTYQLAVVRSGQTMTLPVTGIVPLPPEEQVQF